jgi:DNA-binding response OmpR family regulator
MQDRDANATSPAHMVRPSAPDAPLRTLLVEDDLDLLAAVSTALQREGHRVLSTSDAELAGDLASRGLGALRLPVDVIVVDQCLPSTTGLAMLARLRAEGHAIPAVLITAYPDESIFATAAGIGSCEVLPKPFSLEGLLDAIERAAALSRAAAPAPAPHR